MKTYYYHLRKVREQQLTENSIVPLGRNVSDNIEIFSDNIKVAVPSSCTEETLSMVLRVLKNAQ